MAIEINKRAVLVLTAVGAALIYLSHGYWWNQTSPGFGILRAGLQSNPGIKIHQTWFTSSDMIPIPESVKRQIENIKILETHINFPFENKDHNILYLHPNVTKVPSRSILFLHGAIFTSKNWDTLNTLQTVTAMGFYPIAVDLPGFGYSTKKVEDKPGFLREFIKHTHLDKPVIVSPSMSGSFSLPFVLGASPSSCRDRVSGLVTIAPIGTEVPTVEDYRACDVPVLIIQGGNDKGLGEESSQNLVNFANQEKYVIPQGGHAVYTEHPDLFHKYLYNFLLAVYKDQY